MAAVETVTVPLSFSMTSTSKDVVKRLIAEVLENANAVFPSEGKIREFVQAEVRAILVEEFEILLKEYREKMR